CGEPNLGLFAEGESLAGKAGIYQFTGKTGKQYIGQSGNIGRRLKQHISQGKLPKSNACTANGTDVPGGKAAREIEEQKRLNQLGGPGNTENQRNPIGPL